MSVGKILNVAGIEAHSIFFELPKSFTITAYSGAFPQLEMDENSQEYFTLITTLGLCKPKRLPTV